MPPIPLLLSAGEASGDMYAAQLADALRARLDVRLFGMGGPQMQAAGVDLVTHYEEVAVVGITEIVKHLPSLLKAMDRIVAEAEQRKPALAILTDFPGFHLRLARKLQKLCTKPPETLADQILADLDHFKADAPTHDDETLVVVKVK